MMRPGVILGVARAEARLTRRLVRYWLFLGVAAAIAGLFYLQWFFIHRTFSSYSATAGLINPRFMMGFLGLYYQTFFMLGLVFLGFDVRARDVRERVSEVVDALPCTNLELVFGKYLGILIPSWIPVVVIALAMALIGLSAGAPIEPLSLVTFTVPQAIPGFTFLLGLVFLVSLLARHRGLAALALIGVIVGVFTISFRSPAWLSPATDITGAFTVPFPSDIVRGVIDWIGTVQRLGTLLAGFGLLVLAAAVHPRPDHGARGRRALVGVGLLALAGILLGGLVIWTAGLLGQFDVWQEAHRSRKLEPAPDVLAMDVSAIVRPGRSMTLDIDMRYRAPEGQDLDRATFSLNPGLVVSSITDQSGTPLRFEQDNGFVDVELPNRLAGGTEAALRWTIDGAPDPMFAYLDSPEHIFETIAWDGQVFMLGYESLVFRPSHVSLLPGVRWLPASGSEIGRGDPTVRPIDFYQLKLTVELPEGWLPAGPGRREDAGSADGRVRFRFAPAAPVPPIALIAGRYESFSTEIEEVQAELLVHPGHADNFSVFEDAVSAIEERIAQRLRDAAEVGLDYPYGAITLVEVPNLLRSYEGGWRMGSAMGPPGIVLARESGLPTARFDVRFEDSEKLNEHEGGVAQAKLEVLEEFFQNDFSAGNVFPAASQSFFAHQTAARGDEGLPLDYVNQEMTNRLVTDKSGFFSAYLYDADMNNQIGQVLGAMFADRRQEVAVADVLIDTVTNTAAVWDAVLGVALAEIDPWEDPKKTINVLTLKGNAMSRSLLDKLGRDKAGALLAGVRERSLGGAYDREDVLAAGREQGLELEEWLDLWIHETELPGFVAEEPVLYRARDAADGTPQYAVRFTLRNDEPVPGLLRVVYGIGSKEGDANKASEVATTDPISIAGRSAVEVGLVSSQPPRWVEVDPYLSLNRQRFEVRLPTLDEEEIVDEEPLRGHREVPWSPPDAGWIVVDDLDEGFSTDDGDEGRGLRLGQRKEEEDTDQGLPVAEFGGPTNRWTRQVHGQAWGKYRHTYAMVGKGTGKRRATFSAEVPRAGNWQLELHLPRGARAKWNLIVEDPSGGARDVQFDATGAQVGWNSLGSFEVAAGEVRVILTDETDGRRVMADAIRWIPPRAASTEG